MYMYFWQHDDETIQLQTMIIFTGSRKRIEKNNHKNL